MYLYTYACKGQMSVLGVVLQELFSFLFERGLSHGPMDHGLCLAAQVILEQPQGSPYLCCPSIGITAYATTIFCFIWVLGIGFRSSYLCRSTLPKQ